MKDIPFITIIEKKYDNGDTAFPRYSYYYNISGVEDPNDFLDLFYTEGNEIESYGFKRNVSFKLRYKNASSYKPIDAVRYIINGTEYDEDRVPTAALLQLFSSLR